MNIGKYAELDGQIVCRRCGAVVGGTSTSSFNGMLVHDDWHASLEATHARLAAPPARLGTVGPPPRIPRSPILPQEGSAQ